ncbi:hypothetical protein F485_gp183 [Aeromonas phage CC2]|uniref:Uncharacterized protein n=1 Tax=Aeromonas phage CC2 TaxID=1204516 RepID=I6WLX2_9CAUD|nr:hypothetical protein F485_gp183 [Aeromonas phage CC2]AFN39223.1 hypothetical protein CC2_112 [Aeromonas phage CC2]
MKMYDISLNEIEQELSSMYNGVVHTGSKPKNNSYIGMNGDDVDKTKIKALRNKNAEYLRNHGLVEIATILDKTVKFPTMSHNYENKYRSYKNTKTPFVACVDLESELDNFIKELCNSGELKLEKVVQLSWSALGMNDSNNDFTSYKLYERDYHDKDKTMLEAKYNGEIFWIRTNYINSIRDFYNQYHKAPKNETTSMMSTEISSFVNYCIVNVRGSV